MSNNHTFNISEYPHENKKPTSLTEWTYYYLKEKILNLEIAPGEQIHINEFAEKLEISRTPIREAIMKLSNIGLVEVRPRIGYFVTVTNEQEVRDLFEVRILVEKYAAKKATVSLTNDEIKKMQKILEDCLNKINEGDFNSFVPTEIEFHGFIQKQLKNKWLSQILDSMNDLSYKVRVMSLDSNENITHTLIEHQKILDSLINRDASAAEKNMEQHLTNVCERIVKIIRKEENNPKGGSIEEEERIIFKTRF